MKEKNFKKYYKNYLFLVFILGSFVLSTIYQKQGLQVYYVIALAVFILSFTNFSFIKELGLSFKILKDKKTYIYIIPVIVLSNIFLFFIEKYFLDTETQLINNDPKYKLILAFSFINCIRIFGEEFIFRGFLLIKRIKDNNKLFWLLNIVQAIIFGSIHTLFVDGLISKIVVGIYALALSVYFGWLNRKFNSILPSWLVHWMNGLHILLFACI